MRFVVPVALSLLVLLAVGSVSGVAAVASATERNQLPPAPDGEVVVTTVHVHADGDATVTVEQRRELANDTALREFRAFNERLVENRSAVIGTFTRNTSSLVSGASEATGRPMKVRNVSVETELHSATQPYGIIRYSYEWTGFANRTGTGLQAAGSLVGYRLDANDRLVLEVPSSHEITGVSPPPAEWHGTRVVWTGPVTFDVTDPRLTALPTATSADRPAPPATPNEPPLLLLLGTVAVLAALGAGLYRYRPDAFPGQKATAELLPPEQSPASSSPPDPAPNPEPTNTDDPVVDFETLSDEERVVHVLDAEGGRAKQQDIVTATGWSESKVSKVVSRLATDGRVRKLRLGRENVLELQADPPTDSLGHDPTPEESDEQP